MGQVETVPWFPTPACRLESDVSFIISNRQSTTTSTCNISLTSDYRDSAHRIAPKLAWWLRTYLTPEVARRKREGNTAKPTKVVILDNGILSISPVPHSGVEDEAPEEEGWAHVGGSSKTGDAAYSSSNGKPGGPPDFAHEESQYDDSKTLWNRIKEERSFVDGSSRLSPWSFASNPHGTQMANLICAIDPFCELYVARVAEDAMGITSKRVAQVYSSPFPPGTPLVVVMCVFVCVCPCPKLMSP